MSRHPYAVVCVTGLLLWPTSSAAQSVATSFNELRRTLNPGDEILVRHADGRVTREHVRAVTDASLDVQSKSAFGLRPLGPARSLAESSVTEVKRVDSPINGMWIGIGGGIVATYAACKARCIAFFAYPAGAMGGAVVGMAVDAAIRETLYRAASPRSGATAIAFTPWFTRRGGGTSLTIRF